jgi:hypothetical protein
MLRFKSLPVLLGVLASVLWPHPSEASIVQALDLDQLVGQSDRILLGKVVFSESFQRANGMLGTWHRIEIERDIRGNAEGEREVIVETLGGQLGDIGMRVEGEPAFAIGERVILFARGHGAFSAFRPVGMGQGVMRVRSDQGVETVTQTREGMMLMRRDARGQLQKSLGALSAPERLDVFLSKVRTILEQQKTGGARD